VRGGRRLLWLLPDPVGGGQLSRGEVPHTEAPGNRPGASLCPEPWPDQSEGARVPGMLRASALAGTIGTVTSRIPSL